MGFGLTRPWGGAVRKKSKHIQGHLIFSTNLYSCNLSQSGLFFLAYLFPYCIISYMFT